MVAIRLQSSLLRLDDNVIININHAKTDHVPANYVLEMHYDFDDDNKPSVYTGYTRYEIYYCSDA